MLEFLVGIPQEVYLENYIDQGSHDSGPHGLHFLFQRSVEVIHIFPPKISQKAILSGPINMQWFHLRDISLA